MTIREIEFAEYMPIRFYGKVADLYFECGDYVEIFILYK